jgi:hypothetical protein
LDVSHVPLTVYFVHLFISFTIYSYFSHFITQWLPRVIFTLHQASSYLFVGTLDLPWCLFFLTFCCFWLPVIFWESFQKILPSTINLVSTIA